MSDQYEALAGVYDALMYDAGYDEWAAYILKLLDHAQVPKGSRVLEYACGTGNITLPLAKAGFAIVAMDISEEMLFAAQEKTRRQALCVEYAAGDMCSFVLNKPADVAVCACDGVNYVLEEKQLAVFFRQVYSNLKKDGAFLFDISSHYKLAHVLGNEFYFDDGDGQTYFWQNAYDENTKLLAMDIILFVAEGEGYKRYDERHTQRAWTQKEITAALQTAGFEDINAYAFLTDKHPAKQEERIQFTAIRKD
ncbi:MAG: methyltransferase domain-containing protein [Christensenella sp.]|uniref:class I SAM-dependent DNA methyltransferase n=1 Tax=Christensenella sp. TaxID=1935934 RepID=UPI002B21BBF5|nr:methyltransferase domain-containing protein [Christensenella sp.]MEA5002834.1 methyltransferase domain-containing protein [Christensenella sp.]